MEIVPLCVIVFQDSSKTPKTPGSKSKVRSNEVLFDFSVHERVLGADWFTNQMSLQKKEDIFLAVRTIPKCHCETVVLFC